MAAFTLGGLPLVPTGHRGGAHMAAPPPPKTLAAGGGGQWLLHLGGLAPGAPRAPGRGSHGCPPPQRRLLQGECPVTRAPRSVVAPSLNGWAHDPHVSVSTIGRGDIPPQCLAPPTIRMGIVELNKNYSNILNN